MENQKPKGGAMAMDIPMDEEGTLKEKKVKRFEELKKKKIA